jgi:hypothetical protein
MRPNARLTVLGIAAAALTSTAGIAAFAGPGPDASQCGGGAAPAGAPVGPGGAVLVLASNQGGETASTVSCSYVFNGTQAPEYSAATPNTWTITATHTYAATNGTCAAGDTVDSAGTTCTHTDAAANGGDINNGGSPVSANGTLAGAKAGDTITITATYGCVSGDPSGDGCGGVGVIAVGNPA